MSSVQSFSSLLSSVKGAEEDFEFYPTTPRMIDVIAHHMDKGAASIMDIGAGDGRALTRIAEHFTRAGVRSDPPVLYSIEKSNTLIQAQPESIIPVGTDLFQQNLACLPVDYIVSNPPYSQYETWAQMIIETGYARRAFLIIPQRWKDNPGIKSSLTKRGATARVIHSDNFLDAERKARAVVDIVEISYPLKSDCYSYRNRNKYEGETGPTHYALDYRIVLERYRAIRPGGGFDSWQYPQNLDKGCHDTIADIIAVLFNLGFPVSSASTGSMHSAHHRRSAFGVHRRDREAPPLHE